MSGRNRRFGVRIPLEMILTQYVNDKPFRALTTNVSESGVYLNLIKEAPFCRDTKTVALEFQLPGTDEVIWARGEICYDHIDRYFHGTGIKFTAMPKRYARMIRDYCVEKRREQLGDMLARIRTPAAAAVAA